MTREEHTAAQTARQELGLDPLPDYEEWVAQAEAINAQAAFAREVRETALAYRARVTEWQQIIAGGQASAPESDADPLVTLEWLRQVAVGLLDLSAEQMVLNQGLISLVLNDYPEPVSGNEEQP